MKKADWLAETFTIDNICQLYTKAFPEEQFFSQSEEPRADAGACPCNQRQAKASRFEMQ